MPPKSDFPGTGEKGNGISPMMRSQGEWIRNIVNVDGCAGCHQMGNKATREIPKMFLAGEGNGVEAWERRILAGQAGAAMNNRFTQVGRKRALADVRRLDQSHRRRRDRRAPRRRGRRAASATSS